MKQVNKKKLFLNSLKIGSEQAKCRLIKTATTIEELKIILDQTKVSHNLK